MDALLRSATVAIAAVLFTGCSAQSKLTVTQDGAAPLTGYKAVAVDVTAVASKVSSNRDYRTVHDNLVAALTRKIPARTPFALATDPKAPGTVLLLIDVRELRYTSQAARIMAGQAAGGSILGTQITLSDGATGTLLWQAESYATTKGQAGIAAASTTTQIEALSDQLIAELQARLDAP